MPSKSKEQPAPEPLPRVGGSFTLNHETGAWEPTPIEPEQTPVTAPDDGTDS